MIVLICFILSCYGVTNIVTSGKIFEWFRDLVKPIPILGYYVKCPMCVSVPIGMLWFLVGLRPEMESPFWVSMLSCGMISSGCCWIIRVILGHLGEDAL